MGSDLGLFACFINDNCVLVPARFPQVSLTALNGVIIEGFSEESGLSPVIVKDSSKSLSKLERTMTRPWSSSK